MSNFPWDTPPSRFGCEKVLGINAWDFSNSVTNKLKACFPSNIQQDFDQEKHFLLFSSIYFLEHLSNAIVLNHPVILEKFLSWTLEVLQHREFPRTFVINQADIILELLQAQISPEIYTRAMDITTLSVSNIQNQNYSSEDKHTHSDSFAHQANREEFLQNLLNGKSRDALKIATKLLEKDMSFEDICVDLIQWAMYRVGNLWEENKILWSEERVATAICQFTLSMVYSRFPRNKVFSEIKNTTVVLRIEGEQHDLGGWIISDILELYGLDVFYINGQFNPEHLIKQLGKTPPRILGISSTLMCHLVSCKNFIESARSFDLLKNTKIVVGGQAFTYSGLSAQSVGGDQLVTNGKTLIDTIRPLLQD